MREGHSGHHGHRTHGELREHGDHGGHGHMHGKKEFDQHPKSAQTFRRGRATAFLEKLAVRRSTLQRQLADPQFDTIKPIVSGELKATEAIIDEFIHMFQLQESASDDQTVNNNNKEAGALNNVHP